MKFISVPVDGGEAVISCEAIAVIWHLTKAMGSGIQLNDGENIGTTLGVNEILDLIERS